MVVWVRFTGKLSVVNSYKESIIVSVRKMWHIPKVNSKTLEYKPFMEQNYLQVPVGERGEIV